MERVWRRLLASCGPGAEAHDPAPLVPLVLPFGAIDFDFGGHKQHVFWKIDCYDKELRFGSPDPADPAPGKSAAISPSPRKGHEDRPERTMPMRSQLPPDCPDEGGRWRASSMHALDQEPKRGFAPDDIAPPGVAWRRHPPSRHLSRTWTARSGRRSGVERNSVRCRAQLPERRSPEASRPVSGVCSSRSGPARRCRTTMQLRPIDEELPSTIK